jgi:hypothetical protein
MYLPEEGIMQDVNESNQELAAEAFEKSKLMVSFAVTPATQKPKLSLVVGTRILNSKSSENLGTGFKEEDHTTDKVVLDFEDLEAPSSED